jgi:uncharacterized protein YciI
MPIYFVFRDAGENWVPELGPRDQPDFLAHAKFVNDLHSRDIARIGGRLIDDSQFMIAVYADNLEQARDAVEPDPWIKNGVLKTIRITEFQVLLGKI